MIVHIVITVIDIGQLILKSHIAGIMNYFHSQEWRHRDCKIFILKITWNENDENDCVKINWLYYSIEIQSRFNQDMEKWICNNNCNNTPNVPSSLPDGEIRTLFTIKRWKEEGKCRLSCLDGGKSPPRPKPCFLSSTRVKKSKMVKDGKWDICDNWVMDCICVILFMSRRS